MKRFLFALPLWAGLALPFNSPQAKPMLSTAAAPVAVGCEVSEPIAIEPIAIGLPWSTVSAVLKRVSELHDYTYAALVDGYNAGLVTVEQSGSGYLVRITDEDGIVDQILIDSL